MSVWPFAVFPMLDSDRFSVCTLCSIRLQLRSQCSYHQDISIPQDCAARRTLHICLNRTTFVVWHFFQEELRSRATLIIVIVVYRKKSCLANGRFSQQLFSSQKRTGMGGKPTKDWGNVPGGKTS